MSVVAGSSPSNFGVTTIVAVTELPQRPSNHDAGSLPPMSALYEAFVDLLDDRTLFLPRRWPFWGRIKIENDSFNYLAEFVARLYVSAQVDKRCFGRNFVMLYRLPNIRAIQICTGRGTQCP